VIASDTTWTEPLIDDGWGNEPHWTLRQDHPWWCRLGQLLDLVAADAAGRYLVMTPDLGGSGDVLLNLRGSEGLCLDVLERPERIRRAVEAIYPAWHQAWRELYRRTLDRGAGLLHWLGIWSSRPYAIPACDFCCMISPDDFRRLLLDDIARQAAAAGRAVFHLDGPGATRHLDALLELPQIHAIQFTPGQGTTSTLPWIDMFKRIQQRGKALYVFTPAQEVLTLAEALRPQGLAIAVEGAGSPRQINDLFEQFCRRFTTAQMKEPT
jgi:hypothetical protein